MIAVILILLFLAKSQIETKDKRPILIGTILAGGIFVVAACVLLARRIVMKKRGQTLIKLCLLLITVGIFNFSKTLHPVSAKKKGRDAEQIFERVEALAGGNKGKFKELPLFEFQVLAAATNNFSLRNKLGQGGFGPVYKVSMTFKGYSNKSFYWESGVYHIDFFLLQGKLQEGQEIAVKRLSRASGQGLEELVNEVVVISKLQHRNLVKLLGCCIAGEERMLVYEFMPKKSLDYYLFGNLLLSLFLNSVSMLSPCQLTEANVLFRLKEGKTS